MMPLMNGLELAERFADTLSGHISRSCSASGGHAGWPARPQTFRSYSAKPFDVTKFIDIVIDLIGDPGAGRRLRQPALISAAIGWLPLKISCQVAQAQAPQCDFGH